MACATFRRLANYSTTLLLACLSFSIFGETTEPFTENSLSTQGARISHHAFTGRINFLGSTAGKSLIIPDLKPEATSTFVARQALQSYGKLFGLRNPVSELTQKVIRPDDNGRTTFRYQQIHNDIPVIGGELYVNLGKGNSLLSINGEVSTKLTLSTQSTITSQQATETALAAVSKWYGISTGKLHVEQPTLAIYDPQLLGPDRSPVSLVWKTEITATPEQPIREMVLIDAQRGHISLHIDRIAHARNRRTFTAMETFILPGTEVCGESDTDCLLGVLLNNPNAVKAHLHTKDTYNFYSAKHGRDSIDGAGMPLISTVNWFNNFDSSTCPIAFWTGEQMVYCTGMAADDIVAHEITHGVTDHTSNLYSYYQSGAISESFADLWGEFVDLGNGRGSDHSSLRWLIGEDATALTEPVRDMADPPRFNQPDKMSSPYYYTGSSDNGGIHINSGINNKAVYLMVDGGTFNGFTISGIGIDKTAKIYYEVQTRLLTSGADYLDLYNTLYQGCRNLVGSAGITDNDCVQVRLATEAVEMNQQPVGDFNPHASLCPANEAVATTLFSEDFENGFNQWSLSNAGMGINWDGLYATQGIVYATSGIEALNGFAPFIPTDQRAEITITLPNESVYLHFKHFTEFEYSNGNAYDAGVLEYSLDNGSTWVDAAPLFVAGKRYNGTVANGILNILAGREAFVGDSHGYVSTRVNLTSLAGQTIRLRWRVGSDSTNSSAGWLLDDISVHTCAPTPTFAFSSASYSVSEEDGNAIISVSRYGSSAGIASVDYSVSANTATVGSDFTATSGTLIWADGDNNEKTFTIAITDDGLFETDETLSLILSNPSAGAQLGQQPIGTLTLLDNDPPTTLAFSYPLYTVNEADDYAYVYVSRGSNVNGAVSVDYKVHPGSARISEDYIQVSGSLGWADGDGADKYFLIPLVDDRVYEGTETIQLVLSSPTGGAVLDAQSTATLNIVDDENPPGSGGGGALGVFLLFWLLLQRFALQNNTLK